MEQPKSLTELKQMRQPLRDINLEQEQSLSTLDNLALWITNHVGTMGFFLIIFFWTVLWLAWNTLAPKEIRFDPFPSFVLWLFIANIIQICLMPLIMVGQNLQSQHAERRSESDFEINKRAEREVEAILMHLENQDELLQQIVKKLDVK